MTRLQGNPDGSGGSLSPADGPVTAREAGLGRDVSRGAAWSAASVVVLRFANIALMAVVARIVSPSEFGVFALALTAYTLIVTLAELGTASAIARADVDPDKAAPTAVSVSIIASLLLAGAAAAVAEPIASMVGNDDAATPLRVLAISIALIGPIAVPTAQLQRNFRQDRLFLANAVSFVPRSVVLLVLAASGDGAVAFAWSTVAGQVAVGFIVLSSVNKRYRPGLNRQVLGPLLKFGLPLTLANLLSQILLNVDYVFVGRMLGPEQVGLYVLAFNVAAWPTAVVGSIINSVVLPGISRARSEGGDLPLILARSTQLVVLFAAPIGALTAALARPLIQVLYGSQWISAAPVLSVLSIYGVFFVLGLLYANSLMAIGNTGVLLGVQLAALVALLPTMWWGLSLIGVEGVAVAHVAVILVVSLPIYVWMLRRRTGTSPGLLLRSLITPGLAALVCAAVAVAVSRQVGSPGAQLVLGGTAGLSIYALLVGSTIIRILPTRLLQVPPLRQLLAKVPRLRTGRVDPDRRTAA